MQCFDWDERTCNMHNVGLTTESVCAMKAKITCWEEKENEKEKEESS